MELKKDNGSKDASKTKELVKQNSEKPSENDTSTLDF